jgi:hypothetical protein
LDFDLQSKQKWSKKKVHSGDRTRDLLHPKQESYL